MYLVQPAHGFKPYLTTWIHKKMLRLKVAYKLHEFMFLVEWSLAVNSCCVKWYWSEGLSALNIIIPAGFGKFHQDFSIKVSLIPLFAPVGKRGRLESGDFGEFIKYGENSKFGKIPDALKANENEGARGKHYNRCDTDGVPVLNRLTQSTARSKNGTTSPNLIFPHWRALSG